ncbi:MAG: FAD/NAD(P)-binding protein [Elusimicrobia bacterium]|nr:FAD/NAD(P)-binding protein [Elusimicrobiota bacterium]
MVVSSPWLPAPFRVARRTQEDHETVALELEPPAGGLPSFRPGQFNMLYVPGVGEVALSICGAAEGRYRHALRAVGPVTRALAALSPGDAVGLRGPFGSAWPLAHAEDRDVVLLAGGIGLAPLKPALEELLRRRERYARVVVLIGARSPSALVFRPELEAWRRDPSLEVDVTVDRSEAGWRGRVGMITALLAHARLAPAKTVAWVCGPEIMMRFVAAELERLGVPLDRVHVALERNMKCAVGFCGHCQLGPAFVCKDGPVFPYSRLAPWLAARDI